MQVSNGGFGSLKETGLSEPVVGNRYLQSEPLMSTKPLTASLANVGILDQRHSGSKALETIFQFIS